MSETLLSLRGIVVTHPGRSRLIGPRAAAVRALDGVDLQVTRGECVGIVGESGSGKSTLARIVVGLARVDAGEIRMNGQTLPARPRERPSWSRRFVQIVPQDPYASLDPTFTVEASLMESLAIHRLCPPAERRDRAASVLETVGLGAAFLGRRPHELSGGQRQRVAIGRALIIEPALVVLDEPTSALDLSVQAQVLNLLLRLQTERGLAFVLISHDIDVVGHLAHRIHVMRAGRFVESGETAEVLNRPRHPYTRTLIASAPKFGDNP